MRPDRESACGIKPNRQPSRCQDADGSRSRGYEANRNRANTHDPESQRANGKYAGGQYSDRGNSKGEIANGHDPNCNAIVLVCLRVRAERDRDER